MTTPVARRSAGSTSSPRRASASSAPAPPRSSARRHLAESAKQLLIFQRTPSSIDVRANAPTDAAWAAQLAPGWQQKADGEFQQSGVGIAQDEDLVSDGWTDIMKLFAARSSG